MLGRSSGDTLPPKSEGRGFQRSPHHLDDLSLRETRLFLDFLKSDPILPCKEDNPICLFGWELRSAHFFMSVIWLHFELKRQQNHPTILPILQQIDPPIDLSIPIHVPRVANSIEMALQSRGNTSRWVWSFWTQGTYARSTQAQPSTLWVSGSDRIAAWHLRCNWFSHLQIRYLHLLRHQLSNPVASVPDSLVDSAAIPSLAISDHTSFKPIFLPWSESFLRATRRSWSGWLNDFLMLGV